MKGSAIDWTGRTLLGKWKVERVIGIGGTSVVLQARHRNGRRAALKILHPHLAAHGRTRERFLREGRMANLVDHPGVVAVLDDFIADDGTAGLVLELVLGQNLASRAKERGGRLDAREVVDAACGVLDVLAIAHDAGVIHRDIKPENILVRSAGGYKLADFGLAGLCHELGMLTGTNALLGTPGYMSPEQARGEVARMDARTDLWGLGATMFTLLTGRLLHAGSASKNLVHAAATDQPPSSRSSEFDIQPELAEIIDRALRMDREERWPNARAMRAALATLEVRPSAARAPLPVAPDDNVTVSASRSSAMSWSHAASRFARLDARWRRRLLWALAAAVLAAFVAREYGRRPLQAAALEPAPRSEPPAKTAGDALRSDSRTPEQPRSTSADAEAAARLAPVPASVPVRAAIARKPRAPVARVEVPTSAASIASVDRPPAATPPAETPSATPKPRQLYRH